MPLSEDDQRKLDQIEQALTKDDPRFAQTVNIDRWRRRRIALTGASFTIGMVVLLVGLVLTQAVLVLGVIISIAGALTMTAATAVFLRDDSGPDPELPQPPTPNRRTMIRSECSWRPPPASDCRWVRQSRASRWPPADVHSAGRPSAVVDSLVVRRPDRRGGRCWPRWADARRPQRDSGSVAGG